MRSRNLPATAHLSNSNVYASLCNIQDILFISHKCNQSASLGSNSYRRTAVPPFIWKEVLGWLCYRAQSIFVRELCARQRSYHRLQGCQWLYDGVLVSSDGRILISSSPPGSTCALDGRRVSARQPPLWRQRFFYRPSSVPS